LRRYNQALSAATLQSIDDKPDNAQARAIGGCPSSRAVCVSSGYGGEQMWEDGIGTSQNVLRTEEVPEAGAYPRPLFGST